jgi:hypothetical protein
MERRDFTKITPNGLKMFFKEKLMSITVIKAKKSNLQREQDRWAYLFIGPQIIGLLSFS